MSFLGFSFYWAWVAVVFYSDVLTFGVPGADGLVETVWLWSTWAHMLALMLHAVLARRLPSLLDTAPIKYGSAVMPAFSTILVAVSLLVLDPQSTISLAAVIAAAVLTGVAGAWMVLRWSQLFATLTPSEITLLSLLSFSGGLLIYFLFLLLPFPISTVSSALLPLFSGVSMMLCGSAKALQDLSPEHGKIAAESSEVRAKPSASLAVSLVAILAFALCGEILRSFSLQIGNAGVNEMGTKYLVGGLVGLIPLTAYYLMPSRTGKRKRLTLSAAKSIFAVMAVAFLLAPFLADFAITVTYGIFGAGFWAFRVISWIVCLFLCLRFGHAPVRVIGVMDCIFALSVVISTQLNAQLIAGLAGGWMDLTTVALVTVFVLMLIIAVALSGKGPLGLLLEIDPNVHADAGRHEAPRTEAPHDGEEPLERSSARLGNDVAEPVKDATAQRMQVIAEKYGFSPREAEVALLLARGRSLPVIQKELFISAGTAQTHSRHIYKKLGIHSKQELLDLVNQDLSR